MDRKSANAFITCRKGFCYLTIKVFGRNHEMMRIRAYKIDPDEKRHIRRLYPEVVFDWKKITHQLAEKREDCRRYRSRSRKPASRPSRVREPLFGVYEPGTRTIYTTGIPSSAAGVGRLLDTILQLDRELTNVPAPPELVRRPVEPSLAPVENGRPLRLKKDAGSPRSRTVDDRL